MKRRAVKKSVFLAAALIAFSSVAIAQSATATLEISAAPASSAMTQGEVRKVDKDAGKITLRHEALENLGMPAMTMVFRVAEPKFLDAVKQGDKVQFVAEKVNGQFTLTELTKLQATK